MNTTKLRRQIAWEAARRMHERQEAEYYAAKMAAARRVCRGWVKPSDLPTDAEIREQLQLFAGRYPITAAPHLRTPPAAGPFAAPPADDHAAAPSRDGLIPPSEGGIENTAENAADTPPADRFVVFESLLAPCELIEQSREFHPEGDVLYHSLQVFARAQDQLPYDEEFLTAALLHDVGKAIDPTDHVQAGLAALDGYVTERTAWLIEHHQQAHAMRDGTIGHRARRRLRESEDFDELVLLGECDRAGRVPGGSAPELDQALAYLRDLAHLCG